MLSINYNNNNKKKIFNFIITIINISNFKSLQDKNKMNDHIVNEKFIHLAFFYFLIILIKNGKFKNKIN
jgi:hypothetical protein